MENSKRKPISKKIRFEVFKRDKFQCQYCGRSAPDIVLNIDHIKPVAKDGDNDICNLITSCFDCNSGKKDRLLSDGSVVLKQRKQLELLQERKEQLELLMQWKTSLINCANDELKEICKYINKQITPFSISDGYKAKLKLMIKKFGFNDIISATDKAIEKYLRYDKNGDLTQDSVNDALNKIGGIANLSNRPEIDLKIGYIRGICKNRFNYCDIRIISVLLNNYISSLRNKEWSDEDIINDLENEVIPITKAAKNWSQWRGRIESWINDINNWE